MGVFWKTLYHRIIALTIEHMFIFLGRANKTAASRLKQSRHCINAGVTSRLETFGFYGALPAAAKYCIAAGACYHTASRQAGRAGTPLRDRQACWHTASRQAGRAGTPLRDRQACWHTASRQAGPAATPLRGFGERVPIPIDQRDRDSVFLSLCRVSGILEIRRGRNAPDF